MGNKGIENKIDKLREIGYTQDKMDELITILSEDIENDIFDLFIDKSSEEELSTFKSKLSTLSTKEQYENIFKEILQSVFSTKWESEVDKMWEKELQSVIDDTLKVRETYIKYVGKDPQTVEKINEIEKSEDFQKMMKDMENSGFDFQSEASK